MNAVVSRGIESGSTARGDIDAIAHEIAVGLLDDVAEMNAEAELDTALGRHACMALGHAIPQLSTRAAFID
jgi:hypothetical protein